MSATAILDRMENAPRLVRRRLLRATRALAAAQISHAVVGGNAIALWVASIDEAAVRNTRDVDIMIERTDLPRVQAALTAAGLDIFLEGSGAKARDAVHILFSGERVRPDAEPNPPLGTATSFDGVPVLSLASLLTMKLSAWHPKDQMHLTDLIEVGLLCEQDFARLPAALRERASTLETDPRAKVFPNRLSDPTALHGALLPCSLGPIRQLPSRPRRAQGDWTSPCAVGCASGSVGRRTEPGRLRPRDREKAGLSSLPR